MALEQDFIAAYVELQKQYDLPGLDELDVVFELKNAVMHEGFLPHYLLRFLRRRIVFVMDSWTNYLHSLVLPGDQSMILYEEAAAFDDTKKQEAMELMRQIVRLNRKSAILEIDRSEASDASFLKEAYENWQRLHAQLKPFVETSLSVWDK